MVVMDQGSDFSSAKLTRSTTNLLKLRHEYGIISIETFILRLLCKYYPMKRDSQASNYNTFYDNIGQILKDLENEG